MTLDRYLALIAAYLLLLVAVIALCLVRGPVRDAAWNQPCSTLDSGGAIRGHWPEAIPACRNV